MIIEKNRFSDRVMTKYLLYFRLLVCSKVKKKNCLMMYFIKLQYTSSKKYGKIIFQCKLKFSPLSAYFYLSIFIFSKSDYAFTTHLQY